MNESELFNLPSKQKSATQLAAQSINPSGTPPPAKKLSPKNPLDTPVKKATIIDKVIIFIFIIALGFSGYLFWQKLTLGNELIIIEKSIEKKKQEIKRIEQIDQIRERFKAERMLPQLQEYRIEWSDVYKRITEQETEFVKFKSFQSGRNYQVTVSGVAKTFNDISIIIKTLKDSAYFSGPFVPTIKGGNDPNIEEFKFSLTFKFINWDKNAETQAPKYPKQ